MSRGIVALTGANGEIGRATQRRLLSDGYRVICVDVDRRSDLDPYVRADLTSPWETRLALDGAATVVHLAAVGNCDHADDWCAARHEKIVRNNVVSTYNVFEAVAGAAGTEPALVVWASSETVVGPPFATGNLPDYVPVDAAHPRRPTSPYGLSKLLCEEIAAYFWRAHAVPSVGLRFSVVQPHDPPPSDAPLAEGLWNLWGFVPLVDAVDAIAARVADRHRLGALVGHVVAPSPAAKASVDELRRRYLPDVTVAADGDELSFWATGSSAAQDEL